MSEADFSPRHLEESEKHIDAQTEAQSQKDAVEKVMKKYDRESNTRLWTGSAATFIKCLSRCRVRKRSERQQH